MLVMRYDSAQELLNPGTGRIHNLKNSEADIERCERLAKGRERARERERGRDQQKPDCDPPSSFHTTSKAGATLDKAGFSLGSLLTERKGERSLLAAIPTSLEGMDERGWGRRLGRGEGSCTQERQKDT